MVLLKDNPPPDLFPEGAQSGGPEQIEIHWGTIAGVGAVFGLSFPARLAFERAAASLDKTFLPSSVREIILNGFLDTLAEYKRMFREGGIYALVKYSGCGAALILSFTSINLLQNFTFQLCGVSEHDIQERNSRWVLGKTISLGAISAVLYIPSCLWALLMAKKLGGPRGLIRKIGGGERFYASFVPFTMNVLIFPLLDTFRAKCLHFWKKTFFPELIPKQNFFLEDDEDDLSFNEEEAEEDKMLSSSSNSLLAISPRKALYYTGHISIFFANVILASLISTPLDVICTRMTIHPYLSPRDGWISAVRHLYREEGIWGFYRGFVANTIFVGVFSCFGVSEEANTGRADM
jgi:hypothetical protein